MGARLRPAVAATFALVALGPATGFAESAASAPGDPIEVMVRAKAAQPDAFDSARAVTTKTSENAHDASPQSLADALRHARGLAVQQTTPGQGTIYVRGLSGREVVHLVDGVRVNAAIFRAGNNPYLGLVDPHAADRIEVVRGPSSVLHGSDALAGVVSITTRLPGYVVSGDRPRLSLFQSVSSNSLGAVSRVAAEYATAKHAAHAGVTFIAAGDVRPGGGELTPDPASYPGLERGPDGIYRPTLAAAQRGTSFQTFAADAAARRKLASGLEVVARGQVVHRPELVRYDEVTPRFRREVPPSAESAQRPLSRGMTSLTLVHAKSSGAYDGALLGLSWQRLAEGLRRRGLEERCAATDAPLEDGETCAGAVRLLPKSEIAEEENRSDAFTVRGEVRLSNRPRTLGAIAGAEVVHDIVSSEARAIDAVTGTVATAPSRYPDGSTMTQGGVFAQGEVELGRGVALYGGARLAWFALDIEPRPGDADPAGFSRVVLDVPASIGARWEVVEGFRVMANAGRGVRAPNVQDFSALGPRAGGRWQVPNPSIAPESSLSVDAGLKLRRGPADAECFVFYLRHDGAIALAPTEVAGETTTPTGERYYRSENASRVDLFGVEGGANVAITRGLGLFAAYVAMMGTQRNEPGVGPPETPADRVPPLTVTGGLWLVPVPALHVELFAYGRARQDRLNDPVNLEDSRIPEGGTPGFVTLHARAAWTATPQVTARLALDNLTNALALEHGSGFYRPGFGATASVAVAMP